jgi:hypothetical protein
MALKPQTTIKNIFAELERLGLQYRKARAGYRKQLYQFMGDAQRIIVKLHKKDELRRTFTLRARKAKRPQDQKRFNLSTEVMAIIMGAKSREARQLASKRGQVLDHLREDGVLVEATAQQIKSRGGIEKIIQEAAKKKRISPEEDENSAPLPKSIRSKETSAGKRRERRAGVATRPVVDSSRNDYDTTLSVRIRASDREEVVRAGLGCRVKLSALRVGDKTDDFKIMKVKILSPTEDRTDRKEDGEWD